MLSRTHLPLANSIYHSYLLAHISYSWKDNLKFLKLYQSKLLSLISQQHPFLDTYPAGHKLHVIVLNNIATALCERFHHTHEDADIKEAAQIYRDILPSCSENGLPKFTCLENLASALASQFYSCEKLDYLDEEIMYRREALENCPSELSPRLSVFEKLADALCHRFVHTGNASNLEEAISYRRQVLQHRTVVNKNRISTLLALATALCNHHDVYGEQSSLDEATNLYNEALQSCFGEHNELRVLCLSGLGDTSHRRFETLSGSAGDIDDSIAYHRRALELYGPDGPLVWRLLSGLSASLLSRIDHRGLEEDINELVSISRRTVSLCPSGGINRAIAIGNCGINFCARFQRFGEMDDLDTAAELLWEAIDKLPATHTVRPTMLNNFAFVRMLQFERLGRGKNLNQSIEVLREAVGPDSWISRDHPMFCSNLASALLRRSDLLQNKDSEEAIERSRDEDLEEAIKQSRDEDLEEAIKRSRDALKSMDNSASVRASLFGILGKALSSLFWHRRQLCDLDEAVECHQNALKLCGPESRYLSSHLNNLAITLTTRFDSVKKEQDLDEAIEVLDRAVKLHQGKHPERAAFLKNLASLYNTRFQTRSERNEVDTESIELSVQLFLESANDKFGNPRIRAASAERWASIARAHNHPSVFSAYKVSLDLLEQCLMIFPSLDNQFDFLTRGFPSLALDAASCAIEKGELQTAVELLERGRALLWSRMRGFRYSLDKLRLIDESLATEFGDVCNQLGALAADHEASSSFSASKHAKLHDQKWTRQRLLSEKWDGLVSRIRQVPGFGDFLQAPTFNQLRSVSKEGPIVMINLSTYRSDALILLRDEADPVLVPLDKDLPCHISSAYSEFLQWQRSSGSTEYLPSSMIKVLRMLWRKIVGPVTEKFENLGLAPGSRVWWCPTSKLCALPLHAAGCHKRGLKNLMDLYVSSYTPTLTALIRARENSFLPKKKPELLIVGQPDTQPPLPMVREEIQLVKSLIPTAVNLLGSDATSLSVLEHLRTTSWAHFACHGFIDEEHPFESSFQLYEKTSLTLRSIMQASLPNPEFAFLSACHSATGGKTNAPDETLHLAAAMQFCGFRSVVGTLWQMRDKDGPEIAEKFYRFMIQGDGDGAINFKNSARALHNAVKLMSDRRDVGEGVENSRASVQIHPASASKVYPWITFIHIGA
ncbi:hypothetical protein K435DRAFT_836223 [Dendrothele bispora CBS 962.96]|uniref:CHAT domain-containing protein n=1 Tax=Dendrothele bispora (strain CBS 962.96) TaxID=1314807 RepID=A0A4S8MJH5_DENBC|nr:hypothetical protein K435DRAFT_836223 [Dendrothele bispora CBS 962.96]